MIHSISLPKLLRKRQSTYRLPLGQPLKQTVIKLLHPETGKLLDPSTSAIGKMWLGSKTRLCLLDESLPNSQDSQDDSITWYTTGDLVRVHHHKYYFTSRVDDVFKVRGTKVQPSQICDALNAHEAVLASYVLPVQHIQTGSDPMIVAFVVPRKGIEPLDERTLFQFIKPALPTVMWPHFIWVVPGFALSPNGKVCSLNRITLTLDWQNRNDSSSCWVLGSKLVNPTLSFSPRLFRYLNHHHIIASASWCARHPTWIEPSTNYLFRPARYDQRNPPRSLF